MGSFKASKPKKKLFHRIQKAEEMDALEKLNSFLESEEPNLVRFLLWVSDQQQQDISYKTLREACLSGELSINELKQWEEEYGEYIQTILNPIWLKALENSVTMVQEISEKAAVYQPSKFFYESYLRNQCGHLITVISADQHIAMQSLLGHLMSDRNMHAEEASRFIRPLIGLNRPQMRANYNYYNSILQSALQEGKSEEAAKKIATEKAAAKAVKQHRYRATMIARTELAFAYNEAYLQTALDAVDCGLFKDEELVKIVCTSQTERMCPECGKMEGEMTGLKEVFSNGRRAPPFHPNCACTLMYDEKWLVEQFGVMGGGKPKMNTAATKPSTTGSSGTGAKPQTGTGATAQTVDQKTSPSQPIPTNQSTQSTTHPITAPTSNLPLTGNRNNGTINFVEAKTLKEAEGFAHDKLGVPHVSYKGCDVVTANEWNKGLTEYFNKFPELKKNFGFVGECHERNKLMQQGAEDYYVSLFSQKYPNYSIENIRKEAKRQAKLDLSPLKIEGDNMALSLSQNHLFTAPFNGISVNSKYGKNSTQFVKTLENLVDTKNSPVGCNTIRSLFDHEMGHQLDDLLQLQANSEIQFLYFSQSDSEMTDNLCRYARINTNQNPCREMVAEAWSEYRNNPQPRSIALAVGRIVEEEYSKFKRGN